MAHDEVEKDIRWIKKTYDWPQRAIAQALGISRATVQRVLAKSQKQKAAA